MVFPKSKRFVIWGLKNTRHSHRYIHQGFVETLKMLEADVLWLNDNERNQYIVKKGDIVIAAGVACKFLPVTSGVHYILHNVDTSLSDLITKKISLQVFTYESKGEAVDNSIALWNSSENTLYQPWGLSEPSNSWLIPRKHKTETEFWIGAIWDNELKQGNKSAIDSYKKSLKQNKINFKRLGGTRSISLNGLSSRKSFDKVNQSAIGAAIVGDWQKKNGYIPCRAFKNVASGALPISNSAFKKVFGDAYLHADSMDEIVEIGLNISHSEIVDRSENCKAALSTYSYEASLNRILSRLL